MATTLPMRAGIGPAPAAGGGWRLVVEAALPLAFFVALLVLETAVRHGAGPWLAACPASGAV
jgi:hypothetical protein